MNFGPDRIVKGWEMTAAGYTGVWATGNTRAELWDAMMRRETYATSGPRMIVRFFGGYDFTQADATRTPAVAGYAKGVPMGGDLPAAPAGKAPTFLVAALKDRFSGNLDRIQIIKGWLDKDGKPQEKIYDVVWGGQDRRRIVNGKLTAGGQHRRRRHRHVYQHHRRPGTHHRVDGPGLRSVGPRGLLRARARDPDATLDRLRCGLLQDQDHGPEGADDDAGASVHVTDLVFAKVT